MGNVTIGGITINGDVHIHSSETIEKPVHKLRTTNSVTSAKKKVKARDGCCQICGERDKILEVHHIFPISKYPQLASDEKNLITLCQHHHRKYHDTYAGEEGAESFAKFVRDYGNKF